MAVFLTAVLVALVFETFVSNWLSPKHGLDPKNHLSNNPRCIHRGLNINMQIVYRVLFSEIEHEVAEFFDAFDGHGVVDRRPAAAYRTVAFQFAQVLAPPLP